MKLHIKFAIIVCCAAVFPFFSSRAETFQVQVGAGGLKFTPQNVTIKAGDTVEWVWAANGHSSTSGTPGNPDGLWDSGLQNSGFVFSQTFSTAGTFSYYCSPHGACCGMVGSVIVTEVAQAVGAVFVNANASSNQVWMYTRASDGQLSLLGAFSTQGAGGSGLLSQGGVTLGNRNKFLFAVNAGSNDITAFQVKRSGLTFVGKVPSGGTFPNSIAVFGNLLYVLNAKGASANITGFRIQNGGALVAIAGSTRLLSTARPEPAQVGFTPDGTMLIVSEKATDQFDTYTIGADGLATGPTAQRSAGGGPFGFAFDNAGHLVVSEVSGSAASSYVISDGVLQVVTARLKDFGRAACWVANTNDPNLSEQYSYVINTSSNSVSGLAIASDGSISLLDADGKTALLPSGAFPLDAVVSSDSKYLYVLEGKLPGIAGFQIQSDGSLVQIQDLRGTPRTSWGLTGY